MTNIAKSFLLAAGIFLLIGMIWGIQMSASGDHTLAPAHGHLNLIGFVAMTAFGIYYALTPAAATTGLARLHFWLALVAVVLLAPGIVMAINETTAILAQIGSLIALASGLVFLWVVYRFGIGQTG